MKEPDWGLDDERKKREFEEFLATRPQVPDFMLPPDIESLKGGHVRGF